LLLQFSLLIADCVLFADLAYEISSPEAIQDDADLLLGGELATDILDRIFGV